MELLGRMKVAAKTAHGGAMPAHCSKPESNKCAIPAAEMNVVIMQTEGQTETTSAFISATGA